MGFNRVNWARRHRGDILDHYIFEMMNFNEYIEHLSIKDSVERYQHNADLRLRSKMIENMDRLQEQMFGIAGVGKSGGLSSAIGGAGRALGGIKVQESKYVPEGNAYFMDDKLVMDDETRLKILEELDGRHK